MSAADGLRGHIGQGACPLPGRLQLDRQPKIQDAYVIINHQHWPPTSTVFATASYPSDEEIISAYKDLAAKVLLVDARGIADGLNNRRVANSVLIGALSSVMEVSPEDWLSVLTLRVPTRHKEINREAFYAGRDGQWLLEN